MLRERRTAVSALGERMPLSHGANMTPSARGDLGHPVEVLQRRRRPGVRPSSRGDHHVEEPLHRRPAAVVVVDQHVLAGQRRGTVAIWLISDVLWTACGLTHAEGC